MPVGPTALLKQNSAVQRAELVEHVPRCRAPVHAETYKAFLRCCILTYRFFCLRQPNNDTVCRSTASTGLLFEVQRRMIYAHRTERLLVDNQ